MLGVSRVGHAGTLDPLATGVLVVGVGAATRLIEYVQRMTKSYRGTFLLGRSSPTEDLEGEVTLLQDPKAPTLDEVTAAAGRFVGRIQQRPPAFSALKVQGRPAYRLARQGRPVELASREVTIHRLAVVGYEYPELVLEVECSGGTYIRAGPRFGRIAGHRGRHVGPGADGRGQFYARPGGRSARLNAESCAARLEPLVRAVEMLPKIVLSAEEAVRIGHGLTIRTGIAGATGSASVRTETALAEPVAPNRALAEPVAHEMAAVDESGRLVAIVGPAGEGLLRPLRTFPPV